MLSTIRCRLQNLLDCLFPNTSAKAKNFYLGLVFVSVIGFLLALITASSWSEWLSNTGSWASTIALVPIVIAGYKYAYGRPAELRRNLQKAQTCEHAREGVFIVDLKVTESAGSVFRKDKKRLGLDRIPESNIVAYNWEEPRYLTPQDMPKVLADVEEKYQTIINSGIQKIHLFYAGPIVVGPMVGDILSNQAAVELYEYREGEYYYWSKMSLR